MPLLPGSSKEVISENIRTERNAGRPEKQAIAIAFANARRGKKAPKAKMPHPSAHEKRETKD